MRPYNQEILDKVLKFVNKYYQEHHSSPTINEVAAGVGAARSTRQILRKQNFWLKIWLMNFTQPTPLGDRVNSRNSLNQRDC